MSVTAKGWLGLALLAAFAVGIGAGLALVTGAAGLALGLLWGRAP